MEEKHRQTTECEATESKFASQEQNWVVEKQQLKLEIEALVSRLRQAEAQKEVVSDISRKIKEREREIEEEKKKRVEMEQRLRASEQDGEKEARNHADELWRHKKAFAELVSSHRQLEAEMGRALRQVEAARTELEEMYHQREEAMAMVEQLSAEIVKMHRDSEKEKIPSTMLRKSEVEVVEKLSLQKDLEKQVELDNRKDTAEIKYHRTFFLDHLRNGDFLSPEAGGGDSTAREGQDLDAEDVKGVRRLSRSQMEKRMNGIGQRHHADVKAFSEQMRKDEKLEAYRWRLLTMEQQSERLQSHAEGLKKKLSNLREERDKLEVLLLDREQELRSLKKQINFQRQHYPQIESNRSPAASSPRFRPLWLELRRKEQEEQEGGGTPFLEDQSKSIDVVKHMERMSPGEEKQQRGERAEDVVHTGDSTPVSFAHHYVVSNLQRWKLPVGSEIVDLNSSRKVDLHALAISYKIKRLKLQLLAFEKLAGDKNSAQDEELRQKSLLQLLPQLYKQARRYRSLEDKADGLCQRMEKEAEGGCRGSSRKGFLEEAFQLQRHVVAAGQRSAEVNSQLSDGVVCHNGERFQDSRAGQFADVIRTLLRDIQRGLEVRVARIIGNLEGALAHDGILQCRRREDDGA